MGTRRFHLPPVTDWSLAVQMASTSTASQLSQAQSEDIKKKVDAVAATIHEWIQQLIRSHRIRPLSLPAIFQEFQRASSNLVRGLF